MHSHCGAASRCPSCTAHRWRSARSHGWRSCGWPGWRSGVDAELALGRHHELVAELEPLVAEQVFRERLRGQLMLALYRCGRQADALHVFQSGRRTLVEEIGIEPGRALR